MLDVQQIVQKMNPLFCFGAISFPVLAYTFNPCFHQAVLLVHCIAHWIGYFSVFIQSKNCKESYQRNSFFVTLLGCLADRFYLATCSSFSNKLVAVRQ